MDIQFKEFQKDLEDLVITEDFDRNSRGAEPSQPGTNQQDHGDQEVEDKTKECPEDPADPGVLVDPVVPGGPLDPLDPADPGSPALRPSLEEKCYHTTNQHLEEQSERESEEVQISQRDSEKVQIPQSDPEHTAGWSEKQAGGWSNEEEDLKQRLTSDPQDFPDSLLDLLLQLQEGRRLNDQRCSFSLESPAPRRRSHSEPNTRRPKTRVVFSSVTSLQREEFFMLLEAAQSRRLEEQRAPLEPLPPPPRAKAWGLRGSIRQLSLVRRPAPPPAPPPEPKEDLYQLILSRQAQGRLEEQRSRAPGPLDDEDFFSLLLQVQGGRMEEQRTELGLLHT